MERERERGAERTSVRNTHTHTHARVKSAERGGGAMKGLEGANVALARRIVCAEVVSKVNFLIYT